MQVGCVLQTDLFSLNDLIGEGTMYYGVDHVTSKKVDDWRRNDHH